MQGGQGEDSWIRDRVGGKEVDAGTTENSCRDFSGKGEQRNQEVVGRGPGYREGVLSALEAGRYQRSHLAADGTQPVEEGSPQARELPTDRGCPRIGPAEA